MKEQIIFEDLKFVVNAELHENGHFITYKVYDIHAHKDGTFFLKFEEGNPHNDQTENIEDIQPYLHGFVKWDGCSNWHFDEQDKCMLHGCERGDIQRFGDVMGRCWDHAKENIAIFVQ